MKTTYVQLKLCPIFGHQLACLVESVSIFFTTADTDRIPVITRSKWNIRCSLTLQRTMKTRKVERKGGQNVKKRNFYAPMVS
mmetsp:Transcript_57547/g.120340  ORF Transcript_57547/g.120340 Transcript_57547/m.120340 type:complete len:82 (-) Transcript_57547:336-581(-)